MITLLSRPDPDISNTLKTHIRTNVPEIEAGLEYVHSQLQGDKITNYQVLTTLRKEFGPQINNISVLASRIARIVNEKA
jgi:hypothetical protein